MESQRRIFVFVAGFLGLHLVLPYWDPLCLWGADMLRYQGRWSFTLFLILSVLLLLPGIRQRLLACISFIPSSLNPWSSARAFWRFAILLSLLALGCMALRKRKV